MTSKNFMVRTRERNIFSIPTNEPAAVIEFPDPNSKIDSSRRRNQAHADGIAVIKDSFLEVPRFAPLLSAGVCS